MRPSDFSDDLLLCLTNARAAVLRAGWGTASIGYRALQEYWPWESECLIRGLPVEELRPWTC